jgi:16S rRNA (guanine(527)-N(7))-methyltransferase RsmG
MHNGKLTEKILSACAAIGFEFGAARHERLVRFIGELLQWSRRIHLIGKRNLEETILTQIVDSLLMLRFATEHGVVAGKGGREGCGSCDNATEIPEAVVKVADIGSGAGFPGLVWKIACPDLEVSLYERRHKPMRFLERTIALLELHGIRALGIDAARGDGAGGFDLVVSKAAGRLDLMLPIAAGVLRVGGAYVTIKGGGWAREVDSVRQPSLSLRCSETLPGGRGNVLLFDMHGVTGKEIRGGDPPQGAR